MSIRRDSRNALGVILEVQDENGHVVIPAHVDIRERFDPNVASAIQEFEVRQGDNWPLLGLRYLGDARYWWVVAELSGVIDPFTELVEGESLRTPTVESLHLDILG